VLAPVWHGQRLPRRGSLHGVACILSSPTIPRTVSLVSEGAPGSDTRDVRESERPSRCYLLGVVRRLTAGLVSGMLSWALLLSPELPSAQAQGDWSITREPRDSTARERARGRRRAPR